MATTAKDLVTLTPAQRSVCHWLSSRPLMAAGRPRSEANTGVSAPILRELPTIRTTPQPGAVTKPWLPGRSGLIFKANVRLRFLVGGKRILRLRSTRSALFICHPEPRRRTRACTERSECGPPLRSLECETAKIIRNHGWGPKARCASFGMTSERSATELSRRRTSAPRQKKRLPGESP